MPCIICVAITGIAAAEGDNPAVPITVAEQVEIDARGLRGRRHDRPRPRAQRRRHADLRPGAVRAGCWRGCAKHCPGMIVQFSTGGRSGAGRERGGMLSLRPDMASLAVGSNNFPTRVYENSPDFVDWLAAEMLAYGVKPEIEAFDLARSSRRSAWRRTGRIAGAALRPVRHGREERDAGRSPGVRVLRRDAEAARARRRMVRRRHRAATGSCSTSGASRSAAMPGPGSRTTSASTATRSRRRTPRWSGASSSSARSTSARSRRRPGPRHPRPAGDRAAG